ncbi:hypothetical protein PR048_017141 [Dryococelus australis]|uniref:Uncharacterized protein n=1 Tax=Dryococelus australis TaxID=614101 RepID=A0ABQ9H8V4_9NEOP|nr:hypothetical protein PR048_017141 [Dryococelus australis]
MIFALKHELDEIKPATYFINKGFEDLKILTSQLQETLDLVTKLTSRVCEQVNLSQKDHLETKAEVEGLQQYMSRNYLEIQGVPGLQKENIYDIVCKVAKALQVDLNKGEIDIAHRIPSLKTEMPKPIIVKFINRWKKEEILKAKRMKKHLTTEDAKLTGKVRAIYTNEHLTPKKKQVPTQESKRPETDRLPIHLDTGLQSVRQEG